jgi:hypothetical protein
MAKTTARPIAKTAASQELPKRNDGIHPPIVESEVIVGEPLRLGKGRGGDEVHGWALRAHPRHGAPIHQERTFEILAPQASPLARRMRPPTRMATHLRHIATTPCDLIVGRSPARRLALAPIYHPERAESLKWRA